MTENFTILDTSTYRVYGDRHIPTEIPSVPWEHVNTIGLSWGRNKYQEEKDYKGGIELYELYKKVRSLNGKFLLNIGPNPDGTLDLYELKSLIDFSTLAF